MGMSQYKRLGRLERISALAECSKNECSACAWQGTFSDNIASKQSVKLASQEI